MGIFGKNGVNNYAYWPVFCPKKTIFTVFKQFIISTVYKIQVWIISDPVLSKYTRILSVTYIIILFILQN